MARRVIASVVFALLIGFVSARILLGGYARSSAICPIASEAIGLVDRMLDEHHALSHEHKNLAFTLELLILIGSVVVCSVGANIWHRWHESRILIQPRTREERPWLAARVFWTPAVIALAGIALLTVLPAPSLDQLRALSTHAALERIESHTRSLHHVLLAMLGVAACLGILAGHLHRIANHTRRLKYTLAFSSVMLMWLAGTINSRQVSTLTPTIGLMSFRDHAMTAVPILWYVAVHVAVRSICRSASPRRLCFLRWCSVVWAIPLFSISLVLFDGPLVLTVLMIRFHVGQRLSTRPILYFRSFSDADASRVFSRIVAPAAAVHGVVVALVHDQQRGSDLQGSLHPMQCATVLAVPEDEWRSWVEHQLSRASAAILDRTVLSEGLEWELAAASAALGDRLIILERDDTPGPSRTELRPRGTGWLVRHPRGRRAERRTRRVLRSVVGSVVGATSSHPDGSPSGA